MDIKLPSIKDQQEYVIREGNKRAIEQLKKNEKAQEISPVTEINESEYCNSHLLLKEQGWKAPEADLVAAYFRHFREYFPEYNTDKRLAILLGLSSDRRVREFKSGSMKVPYEIWRKFLVMTGRVPQEIIEVIAIVPRK